MTLRQLNFDMTHLKKIHLYITMQHIQILTKNLKVSAKAMKMSRIKEKITNGFQNIIIKVTHCQIRL